MRVCLSCASRFAGTGWLCPACGFEPAVEGGLPILAPHLAGGNPADAAYERAELLRAEATHFWFTARSRLIAWAIGKYFPRCASLLDLGCGSGGVLASVRPGFPHVRMEAGDALVETLAVAKRRLPDVSFVQMDIGRLPYDGEFDVACAFDVIEHLDDDEHALREMHRACSVGGGIIVTVPQHAFLWSAVDEYSRHRRRYARSGLVRKVQRAGFVVERATSFMTLVLPALAAARVAKRDPASLDATAELRIGPALNALCATACRIERAVISAGASLPIGGSLLIVARRTA
jgi:ubiquinone/menaquinone biosynthesis C-methylase UbiE